MTEKPMRHDHLKAAPPKGGLLVLAVSLVLVSNSSSVAAAQPTPDEKTLQEAGIGSTSRDLLDFFRKRTLTDQDRRKIANHLGQLGGDSFRQREEATRRLITLGKTFPGTVMPLLRRAAQNPDAEIASRAEVCLKALASRERQRPEDVDSALVAAAVRVLAGRKPPGTIPVLLAYLPNAGDELLEEDIAAALAVVGVHRGQPDPALVAAASDPLPLRRLAAAGALARASGPANRAAARKLLRDRVPRVRLWTARALLAVRDKTAVPALVAMLSEGSLEAAQRAEDLLWRIAGDQSPQVSLGQADLASRRRCRQAWEEWWQVHRLKVDLTAVTRQEERLGLTLVCECWINLQTVGAVRAFDRGGKLRWQIEGIHNTSDVQLLPGRRVLLAETEDRKVTERTWQGKLLWEQKLADMPVSCRRLANGNTFIATHSELLEVTRRGQVVYSHRMPITIYAAQKLRGGHILYIHNQGKVVEIDQTGKEVRSIPAGNTSGWASVEMLPSGRFLIAQYNAGKVLEIDTAGKVLWESQVVTPAHATRLPNGHTLVASSESNRIVELDPAGKQVSQRTTKGRPVRVYQR